MTMRRKVGVILLLAALVSSNIITDEANARLPRLPRLFHLDDYDRCLSQKDGLYCLGIFELSPIHPSPVYQHIKAYTSPFTFNRTRLHRGYCVSERCPSRERNATLRFERCVSERARRHALSARLHTLHHCTSHQHHNAKAALPPNSAQRLFLQIVYAILALNFVGTAYDVASADNRKKIGILTAWSVRASWQRLTAITEDPQLKQFRILHGIKVVATLMMLFGHVCMFYFRYYTVNPQKVEQIYNHNFVGAMVFNGTTIVQILSMISNFLTGYNLLVYSQTHELSFKMLPILVLKRMVRIAPVHLLFVGFTATWWPNVFTGPFQWQAEAESLICRRKFWSHAFSYNNLVDKHDHCLLPTWFLPVDMHLYTVACISVIAMKNRKEQARRLLGTAFIVSSLACGVVNYVKGWQAMVFFCVPESLRIEFRDAESFAEFYTSSWGSLPACFVGLYLAYLYTDLRDKTYNFNKWVKLLHLIGVPLMVMWYIGVGKIIHSSIPLAPALTAAHAVIDRPIIIAWSAFLIIATLKIDGIWQKLFSWSGWRVPSRLSLPVMLCNWLVISSILAKPVTFYASFFQLFIDLAATISFTYLIAMLVALLVEIPVQRFISHFI